MKDYEDALAEILIGAFGELWVCVEDYKRAISPSPAEMNRISIECVLFPLACANSHAVDGNHFKMQAALVIANEIYIRSLADEGLCVELVDCVLSATERAEYQTQIRMHWSAGTTDLSRPNYRSLLRVMTGKAASRCSNDVIRGTESSPDPKGKETLMYVFQSWGKTFTTRTLGPGIEGNLRSRTSIGKSAAMLGRAFFFINDRIR